MKTNNNKFELLKKSIEEKFPCVIDMTGKWHRTEEHKRNMSIEHNYMSEESRKNMSMAHKDKPLSEENKKHISTSVKNYLLTTYTPEQRKSRMTELRKYITPEIKDKISKAATGRILTKETKIKQSLAAKERLSNAANHPFFGKHHSEETKQKISDTSKMGWRNLSLEEKNEKILRIMKASHLKPNKSEQKLQALLNYVCPNKYNYTGDGALVINGLCPDFADKNGQKKVVELYGDYWHRGEDPQDRINLFADSGFDCLVIWSEELNNGNDIEKVIEKIRTFAGGTYG